MDVNSQNYLGKVNGHAKNSNLQITVKLPDPVFGIENDVLIQNLTIPRVAGPLEINQIGALNIESEISRIKGNYF